MWKNPPDETIRKVLLEHTNLVVVGLSPKPERDSHRVTRYMQSRGYLITGINPGHSEILSRPTWPSLRDLPADHPVEIVNIFRRSSRVGPHVDEAIERKASCIWMQLGIEDEEAASKAIAAGITVIMNLCIMVEHRTLVGRGPGL
jgi:uncharacterized protein